MELQFEKQPIKYLQSVDKPVRDKLYRALERLKELEGDIRKLKGYENLYRCKIDHYRILFRVNRDGNIIIVSAINTRTNIKY